MQTTLNENELRDTIEREIQDAMMKMATKNLVYNAVNNKPLEKSRHSEEMEKCAEALIKKLKGSTDNIEKNEYLLEEKSEKSENRVGIIEISSEDDIEIVKDI